LTLGRFQIGWLQHILPNRGMLLLSRFKIKSLERVYLWRSEIVSPNVFCHGFFWHMALSVAQLVHLGNELFQIPKKGQKVIT